MKLNRLLKIAAEREICDFCPDSSDDICGKCTKVKGVTVSEMREYHAAVRNALRRTDEHDKAMEEGPCSLCQFSPPSSCDGKPCCMCPAEAALSERSGEDG